MKLYVDMDGVLAEAVIEEIKWRCGETPYDGLDAGFAVAHRLVKRGYKVVPCDEP